MNKKIVFFWISQQMTNRLPRVLRNEKSFHPLRLHVEGRLTARIFLTYVKNIVEIVTY